MACAEFQDAFAWSEKANPGEFFPVVAYFTRHFGEGGAGHPEKPDAVFYAFGEVFANKPVIIPGVSQSLSGTLQVARNSGTSDEMMDDPKITYDIEIFLDGTLSYLEKLNGKAIGGVPATVVKANCVNNVLLTAVHGSEVVTVGVALKPSFNLAWRLKPSFSGPFSGYP